MGWKVGYDDNWKRDVGYGVPSVCDHPDCSEKIDRGLSYICGGEVYGGERGCGLFFCEEHLEYDPDEEESPQLCDRCIEHKAPYEPKQDVAAWLNHKATHPSWAEWREE